MTVLPRLRTEIEIEVHVEDGQNFLILSDTFGIAEGPIMISAELLEVLEACNGITTFEDLAQAAEVEFEGPQMTNVRAFLGQLTSMGYMEGEVAEQRAQAAINEFVSAPVRLPVCAGSTYAADPDALHKQLDEMLGVAHSSELASESELSSKSELSPASKSVGSARLVIAPHIDFRVAPDVYGPCFNAIRNTDADLFVMIGTSHYWAQHSFILTTKDFETPIGTVRTDTALVESLRDRLTAIDLAHPGSHHSIIAPNDLAHKPEHSLELHAVFLQHLLGGRTIDVDSGVAEDGRPFTIMPILVTGLQGYFAEGAPAAGGALDRAIAAIRDVVASSGRKAVWLVSGDLAHFGVRFGDDQGAAVMMDKVREADSILLRHLAAGNADAFYNEVREADDAYRICGLAPAYVALLAAEPGPGEVVAYDIWDDAETASAVSFAGVVFSSGVVE